MTIQLYAFDTPNGRKISVALEEMGLPYTVKVIDITKDDQFAPDFLKISPNNKIPAIVDPEGPEGHPVSVFESGAILIYLAEKTGQFLAPKGPQRIAALEWLMFQMGGFGPMPGQVHHFLGLENEDDQRYGLKRYMAETLRLYGVMGHSGLGVAASAPQGRPGALPQRQALVRHPDGTPRCAARFCRCFALNAVS